MSKFQGGEGEGGVGEGAAANAAATANFEATQIEDEEAVEWEQHEEEGGDISTTRTSIAFLLTKWEDPGECEGQHLIVARASG